MASSPAETNPWKGFILGVIGSLVGLMAMRVYQQRVAPRLSGDGSQGQGGEKEAGTSEAQPLDDISLVGRQYQQGESSTAALGRILYQQLTGKEPASKELKTTLSYLVHWAYGMGQGGVYGATRGRGDGLDLGGGAAFATGLWLFGDELVVPLLGLQGGPTSVPPVQHVNRLGAHLAYGLGTAAATQALYRLV